MALSLLGSANLIRPGLRPNGSSHTASRHRHLGKGRVSGKRFAKQSVGRWVKRAAQGWVGENGDRSERALHPRKAQAVTRPIPMEWGTIELGRSICKCAWRAEGAQNEDVSLRLVKTTFRQGRSERRAEAYSLWYVEGLSDARTRPEVVFNSR
jgi:hypothetical protein